LAVEGAAFVPKWGAAVFLCAQAALIAFCPAIRVALGGIAGAAKAIFYGLIDKLSTSRIITNAVIGFMKGVVTANFMNFLGPVGKNLIAKSGFKKIVKDIVTAVVKFIRGKGGTGLVGK
jgi:hypothetical protein